MGPTGKAKDPPLLIDGEMDSLKTDRETGRHKLKHEPINRTRCQKDPPMQPAPRLSHG